MKPTLKEWVQERLETAERFALDQRRSESDREGWVEDASYWRKILAAVELVEA